MLKAGFSEFGGFDTATEIIIAFENTDKVPLFRQQRRTGKRIDTATDDNVVIDCRHY